MSDRAVNLDDWRSGDRHAASAAVDRSGPENPGQHSAGLLPCPFCGSTPVREVHPHAGDVIRLACRAERCGVQPATEYLLEEYAESLRRAWNWRWTPAARSA